MWLLTADQRVLMLYFKILAHGASFCVWAFKNFNILTDLVFFHCALTVFWVFVFVFVYLSKWLHRQVLGAYVKYCNAPLSFVINARSTATLRSPFCKRVFNTFSIILTFGMLQPCFTAPWVFMVAVCCGCASMRASDSLGQCSYATCESAPLSTLWRVTLKCLRGLRMLRRAVIGSDLLRVAKVAPMWYAASLLQVISSRTEPCWRYVTVRWRRTKHGKQFTRRHWNAVRCVVSRGA